MVQFITSNPVIDRMNANQARALQEEEIANRLLAAHEQRQQVQTQDDLNRGIAGIWATPTAASVAQSPQPMPVAIQAANQTTDPIYALGNQQGWWEGSAGEAVLAQEAASEAASPLSGFNAQPQDDRLQRALRLAADTKGGGATAMKMVDAIQARDKDAALAAQKRKDAVHVEVIKMLGEGNITTAGALNKQYGLGLDGIFSNPNALQVTQALAASQKSFKLSDDQALAFQEAGAQKFQEVYNSTQDMVQAMNAAVMAGQTAAKGVRKVGKNFLVTPRGYYDPEAQDLVRDKEGRIVMPRPDRTGAASSWKVEGSEVSNAFSSPAKDENGKIIIDQFTGKQVQNRNVEEERKFYKWMQDNRITDTNEGLARYLGIPYSPPERMVRTPDGRVIPLSQVAADTERMRTGKAPSKGAEGAEIPKLQIPAPTENTPAAFARRAESERIAKEGKKEAQRLAEQFILKANRGIGDPAAAEQALQAEKLHPGTLTPTQKAQALELIQRIRGR